jgi:hypothetical protein
MMMITLNNVVSFLSYFHSLTSKLKSNWMFQPMCVLKNILGDMMPINLKLPFLNFNFDTKHWSHFPLIPWSQEYTNWSNFRINHDNQLTCITVKLYFLLWQEQFTKGAFQWMIFCAVNLSLLSEKYRQTNTFPTIQS